MQHVGNIYDINYVVCAKLSGMGMTVTAFGRNERSHEELQQLIGIERFVHLFSENFTILCYECFIH